MIAATHDQTINAELQALIDSASNSHREAGIAVRITGQALRFIVSL